MRIFALPEGLINDLLSGILQQLLEGGGEESSRQQTTFNSAGTNPSKGLMAERLGKGLQNLVQRFDSASDLTRTALQ